MNTLVLERQKDGTYQPVAENAPKSEPKQMHLEEATGLVGGVTKNLLPVAGGGLVALIGASTVNSFTQPGLMSALIKGTGGGYLITRGSDWMKWAGAFLLFDAILDVIPLDRIAMGTFGGILGGGAAKPEVHASQEGGSMNIDQLYTYLRRNA